MKKTLVIFLLAAVATACIKVDTTSTPDADTKPVKDGVFIHISHGSDDAQKILMGLMLADKFSTSHDVLVFFDQQGIELVGDDAPNIDMEAFDPSDEIFERLGDRDVTILACPACMKVAGIGEDDLRDGVEMAEKDMFFDFTEGRILTLDY